MQQLDEYEKKVDDLNTWIDGRMGTLDSIGGVSAKWEIEMELQKLKVNILDINLAKKVEQWHSSILSLPHEVVGSVPISVILVKLLSCTYHLSFRYNKR